MISTLTEQFNTPEESTLIESCKKGDREAFGELISKYERIVYGTVRLKIGKENDALDVSQEVFIKIWRHIAKYRGDCRFSTWVYKIAVNACLDFVRRSKNSVSEPMPTRVDDDGDEVTVEIADENTPSPESQAENSEKIAAVRKAIERLNPEQREIILLRDIEGYSYDEISEMLHLEIGTVKSRISRARNNLREILLEVGADKLI